MATVTLRDPRYVLGAAIAVLVGAYLAGGALELIKLFVDRPRPEEALAAQAQLSHGRSWSHIASFPSGHLMVTAAMAAAAGAALGRLRLLLLAYVAAIALTRVTFGAHFPIDAVVGGLVGYQLGLFSVAITRAFGLLPARSLEPLAAPADAVPLAVAPHSRGA